ncbi:MAG: RNA polymerase sigma-70 factor [Thermoflavifilum sp.]|nr:RNA polymerase sigma-70 factor [Thermoflavifilum sp.]
MMHSYSLLSAEDLLQLMQQDDAEAFKELYTRYWLRLLISAQKRLQQREAAEEAVQTLFEGLWKNRRQIHIHTSLENYLFASIRYIVLRMLYQQMQQQLSIDHAGSLEAPESPEQQVLMKDLHQYIEQVVQTLPERCRRVYQLSRHEFKTHKEIAELMGISEKTVENHLTKALQVIKTRLHQLFYL